MFAISLDLLLDVRLDLMTAALAPHDQPHVRLAWPSIIGPAQPVIAATATHLRQSCTSYAASASSQSQHQRRAWATVRRSASARITPSRIEPA